MEEPIVEKKQICKKEKKREDPIVFYFLFSFPQQHPHHTTQSVFFFFFSKAHNTKLDLQENIKRKEILFKKWVLIGYEKAHQTQLVGLLMKKSN